MVRGHGSERAGVGAAKTEKREGQERERERLRRQIELDRLWKTV